MSWNGVWIYHLKTSWYFYVYCRHLSSARNCRMLRSIDCSLQKYHCFRQVLQTKIEDLPISARTRIAADTYAFGMKPFRQYFHVFIVMIRRLALTILRWGMDLFLEVLSGTFVNVAMIQDT